MTVSKLPGYRETQQTPDARFDAIDSPELTGLCRGVLADGTINLAEAEYIRQWLGERANLLESWPGKELHGLLGKVLADGVLSEGESKELKDLLEEIIGDPISLLLY